MLNIDQAIHLNEQKPLTKQDPKRYITLEMFKAGPQIDSEGDYKVFSLSDLDDVIRGYDRKKHEAPLIVGHEQTDKTPSLGWVQQIWRMNDSLMGSVELTPKAEKLIRDGTFKKVSSSFYTPDAPNNPSPGKMSLRHLALVSIPAVKGLADFGEIHNGYWSTCNYDIETVKETIDSNIKNMTTKRKKSVANHGEGLQLIINVGTPDSETKELPIYDNTGTRLDKLGGPADYDVEDQYADNPDAEELPPTDSSQEETPSVDPDESGDDISPADPTAEADPTAVDPMADPNAPVDPTMAAPADPTADTGTEAPLEPKPLNEAPADDSEDDPEIEDLSTDLESDEDEIAELAANYSHKQLYEALQLQKEAKSSVGDDSSNFGEESSGVSDEKSDLTKDFSCDSEDEKKDDDPQEKEEETKEYKEEEEEEEGDNISSLKERVAQLEEELLKQKRAAREKEVSEFCESVYANGKLTEKMVNKGDLSKFLVTLNNKNTVNFSEGGKQSQFKFMQSFLQNLPSVVSYSEVAAPEVKPKDSIKLQPAAAGYSYSEENLEIHKRALDYSEKNSVDYAVAIKHVLTYN